MPDRGCLSLRCKPSKLVAVFCLAAAPLLCQTRPTFQSAGTLIEVTAIVRDAQGRAPADLTVNDFQLFDAGKRQAITVFEVRKHERLDAVFKQAGQPAASDPAATVLPNRFVAFLVDDQNLVPERFPLATTAAIRHIATLQPGDRAAVVSASGRLVLPFTADRAKLRAALANMGSLGRRTTFYVSRLNSEITCALTYLKSDWILNGDPASMQNCVPRQSGPPPATPVPLRPGSGLTLGPPDERHHIQLENQVRAFADSIVQAGDRDLQSYFLGLSRLIAHMSHMPGERTIITLSPGMYVPPRFHALLNRTIDDAVRAGVVISGIDPRGVYIHDDEDDPATFSDAWGIAETRERVSFMENLTSGTGGRNIRGDNDIAGGIARLRSTPDVYYLLGFSPQQLKMDGKFHPIKVAVNGHGLTVQARSGYYAAAAEQDAISRTERLVQAAFFSTEILQGIPVRLQIRSSQLPDTSAVLTATAKIDLLNVPFRKEGDVNRSNLTLMIGLFDANGNLLNDYWKEITLHPADAALDAVRRSGVEVKSDFDVEPGRYVVRVLVRNDQAQTMGTHSVPVVIRP